MAACGSLQHIFEKPLPENPTLLESLSSWNQIKPVKPIEQSSFTEIFGELHFKETSTLPSSLSSSSPSQSFSSAPETVGLSDGKRENVDDYGNKSVSKEIFSSANYSGRRRSSESFPLMKSESLQLCTEGLGFESSDDVEDLKGEINEHWREKEEKVGAEKSFQPETFAGEIRRPRMNRGVFPPPISSIGKSGKPCVCFKSYRHEGRFILKEIRIPTQEFLHARRENGRLKLQLVQPSDEEILEDEEDEEEDNEDDVEDEEDDEEEEEENDDDKDNNTADIDKNDQGKEQKAEANSAKVRGNLC